MIEAFIRISSFAITSIVPRSERDSAHLEEHAMGCWTEKSNILECTTIIEGFPGSMMCIAYSIFSETQVAHTHHISATLHLGDGSTKYETDVLVFLELKCKGRFKSCIQKK